MKITGRTDIGCKRPENQDDFRAAYLCCGISFAFVCDGMGGASGGKIASSMLAQNLEDHFCEKLQVPINGDDIRDIMLNGIADANIQIYEHSKIDTQKKGMGTTIVAAVICDNILHLVHVGDSRCYLLRNGILQQLTRDHSIVQDLIESGDLSQEQARVHPKKNLITRAVGVEQHIDLEYNAYELFFGDTLLLCSDGLTNCADETVIQVVLQNSLFYDIAEKLITLAKTGGGTDNITAVVLQLPKK